MEDKDKFLEEIFNNDPLGLLDIKINSSNTKTADDRLLASFKEINDFVEKHQREPKPDLNNISEYQLYSRLKNLKEDKEKMMALEPEDIYGILKVEKKEINSIDDIFKDDLLGIFDDDAETNSLFEFKNTPRETERTATDFVARRKPCKNFGDYEELFKKVHEDLRLGKREIVDFKQENLREGNYYIHNGLLLYLKKVSWDRKIQKFESGIHTRPDGRTEIIFENGTTSNMRFQSLYKALHANGKSITENKDKVKEALANNFNNITKEDQEAGFIYILSSKSTDPKIREINNLYKIGYSTTAVEDRIKNAEKEPTYLMAAVKIEAVYRTYNMNTQKFEQLLHNFFGKSCLNIDIYDEKRRRKMPQEWFVAPLQIIEKAIELIISGDIVKYRFDVAKNEIVKR